MSNLAKLSSTTQNTLQDDRLTAQPVHLCSTKQTLIQACNADYQGPQLHFHPDRLEQQVQLFRQLLPGIKPHFAVKANPAKPLLKQLQRLGVDFEIASEGERQLLESLQVDPREVVYSNPIKSAETIQRAYERGVRWFAFDCLEELQKLHRYAPNGHYELRIALPAPSEDDDPAVWPLREKFGLPASDTSLLLAYAAKNSLSVEGVTFHVGSQCLDAKAWQVAIRHSKAIFDEMQQLGLKPLLLNIGGGLPVDYSARQHSHDHSCHSNDYQQKLESIAATIRAEIDTLPKHIEVIAEPGRFFAAPAAELICQVISTTQRQGQRWCYLDCGFYNGLMELSVDFGHQLSSLRKGPTEQWVIAGPTCDSIDTFTPRYELPLDTQAGDLISIPNSGAYVYGCASEFNGFATPAFTCQPQPKAPH